ncbi:MAG: uroporphyrinogen decarboxylase family protein, partial [Armatimonadota bacterium]
MPEFRVPLDNPEPDAEAFIASLMGRSLPNRPPLVEYIVDPVVMRPILEDGMGREWVAPQPGDRDSQAAYLDNFIEFWHRMGYDFVRLEIALPFPRRHLLAEDPAPGVTRERAWVDQHQGTIMCWEDFEKYAWPSLEKMDFFPLEYVNAHVPDGMGLMSCHAGGIYEHLSAIMSYEGLCMALYDAPDLVRAVCNRVGELMQGYYRHLVQLDNLTAVFPGDDMGFRTGTLIAPEHLREYTLPWHRRFAQMAHDAGLPYFVHSCGNVEAIMKDLIEDVGIDGKHSFEDAIVPIQDVQAKYGDRIAVLGGVDVDVLGRQPPDRVREYVRSIIDACAPRGRFAIGSG